MNYGAGWDCSELKIIDTVRELRSRLFDMLTQTKQDDLVQRIVKAVDPLRIILFGSTARGTATSDSDVDVLVIMPDGTHRRQTITEIYRNLLGFGRPSVDVIVATMSDIEKYGESPSLIYKQALHEE